MKTFFLFALLVVLHVDSYGIRSKRQTTAEQQKKLLDELNKDRQEIGKKLGIKFETVTYDPNLELVVSSNFGDCTGITAESGSVYQIIPLDFNENAKYNDFKFRFFNPKRDKIGCTIKYKCSVKADNLEYYGACLFGNYENLEEMKKKLEKIGGVPDVQKYRDLLI